MYLQAISAYNNLSTGFHLRDIKDYIIILVGTARSNERRLRLTGERCVELIAMKMGILIQASDSEGRPWR